jgi:hypothetical protein
MAQRLRREGDEPRRECRERPGRAIGGSAKGGNIARRHGFDQRPHEVGLGREIAIDRPGRDAGACRHRSDLDGAEARFGRDRACGRDDAVVAGGEVLQDAFGAAVGHGRIGIVAEKQ